MPPLVVRRMVPDLPTTKPLSVPVKKTEFKPMIVPDDCAYQVVPPFVVFRMVPPKLKIYPGLELAK